MSSLVHKTGEDMADEQVKEDKTPVGEKKDGKFSIRVKNDDDIVLYENAEAPFVYYEVGSLAQVFESFGSKLTDDQIAFIAEAFPGDENGKVVGYLIDLHNDAEKSKAKANAYQKLLNQYKPATEEDKAKAYDRAIRDFAKARGITIEKAEALLAALETA